MSSVCESVTAHIETHTRIQTKVYNAQRWRWPPLDNNATQQLRYASAHQQLSSSRKLKADGRKQKIKRTRSRGVANECGLCLLVGSLREWAAQLR